MKTGINNVRGLERRPIKINKYETNQELPRQIRKIIKNIEFSEKIWTGTRKKKK